MRSSFAVLIAGSDKQAIDALEEQVRGSGFAAVSLRHISNGHADPLYNIHSLPNVLVLHLGQGYQAMLEELSKRPASGRPRTVVVGPDGDVDAMRLAMRAGANDYLNEPVEAEELQGVLRRLREEVETESGKGTTWTLLMNAKGGSGASFIASNLAHMMAQSGDDSVALMDLDIQFGTLASYLDLQPKHTLLDAIDAIEDLDSVALTGLMEKHRNHLHVLAAAVDRVALPEDVPQQSLDMLLELIARTFRHVVVDAPRQLNHLTATAIERADNVFLVMQQSVTGLHEVVRLNSILRSELGVPDSSISVIVNRYQKNLAVSVANIEQSLKGTEVIFVPNDFRQVMESVDVGAPMLDQARTSSVTKTLMKLQKSITGESAKGRLGRFGESLASLLRA